MSTYLIWGILITLLGLVAVRLDHKMGKVALASAIMATPFGLLDHYFVRDYWQPGHILSASFSIEGMLFSFGNGVFVWLLATIPYRSSITHRLDWSVLLRRFFGYSSIALAIMMTLWSGGLGLTNLGLMRSTLIALLILGALMLWQAPHLWRLGLAGMIGFGLFYAVQLQILSHFDPSFASLWKPSIAEGQHLFGFPAEEMAWAVVYGLVWTIGIGYGFQVHVKTWGGIHAGQDHNDTN